MFFCPAPDYQEFHRLDNALSSVEDQTQGHQGSAKLLFPTSVRFYHGELSPHLQMNEILVTLIK